MTDDPVRLLDEGGSELLRSLISAGRDEEPQAAAMRRTLAAVGAGIALSSVGSAGGASGASVSATSVGGTSAAAGSAALGAGPAVASSTLIVVVKWLAIGAVTGTVASSAVYGMHGALSPPPAISMAPPLQAASAVLSPSPRAAVPAEKLPDPPTVALARPGTPAIAAPAASPREAELGEPLAAEVAALDAARQALRSGDAAGALGLLDGYDGRFPEARMLPEALYLRLEAFTLKGDKADAEAVARRILRVYPASPHAARARSVLGLDR